MIKFSILLINAICLLNININTIESNNKPILNVFIGAGCSHSKDAFELISKNKNTFHSIHIYVYEDSTTAVHRLKIHSEDFMLMQWTFNANSIFKKLKIKKVPTFVIGNNINRKSKKYNLVDISNYIQTSSPH